MAAFFMLFEYSRLCILLLFHDSSPDLTRYFTKIQQCKKFGDEGIFPWKSGPIA